MASKTVIFIEQQRDEFIGHDPSRNIQCRARTEEAAERKVFEEVSVATARERIGHPRANQRSVGKALRLEVAAVVYQVSRVSALRTPRVLRRVVTS